MKKTLLAVALGAVLAASANADQIWIDTITYTPPVLINGSNDSLSDAFDITGAGFVPFVDVATGAVASFWFADDASDAGQVRSERYDIDLGITAFPYALLGIWQTTLTVDLGDADVLTEFALLLELNVYGTLDFTITRVLGDFYVTGAELTATGPDRCGVPDGGMTLALLGLGLLGIVAVRRKLG